MERGRRRKPHWERKEPNCGGSSHERTRKSCGDPRGYGIWEIHIQRHSPTQKGAKVLYLHHGIQTLPLYESLKVFKAANDQEKATLRPSLRKKLVNARMLYSREEWKAVKHLFDGLRSQIYN
jgi:hypothetical protein